MNAMCWTTDGSVGIYGKIVNEDLFDGTTTVRDNFGRYHKFFSSQVQLIGVSPMERVKQLEQVMRHLLSNLTSSVEIAKKAVQ